MRPLKLTIEGKYWDSLLYKGKLHLFTRCGSVETYDWDALIDWLTSKVSRNARTCFRRAFRESNYFYKKDVDPSDFADEFSAIDGSEYALSRRDIAEFLLEGKQNTFPFPHNSAIVYVDSIYSASTNGVHIAKCSYGDFPEIGVPEKITDIPTTQISASYSTLCLATGEDGLWQQPILAEEPQQPELLSEENCDQCEWIYHSIFGSSNDGGAILALYNSEKAGESEGRAIFRRKLEKVMRNTDLNESAETRMWACHDKIYAINRGVIDAFKYQPYSKQEQKIHKIASLQLAIDSSSFVGARASLFGVIIELSNSLVALLSDGGMVEIPGEPVNWRSFPRSKNYENHLHVVRDDCLDVLSFNQDYFVKQQEKTLGVRWSHR